MKIELELNDDIVAALVAAREESDERLSINDAAIAALTTGLAMAGHMPGSFAETVVKLTQEDQPEDSQSGPYDFIKNLMGDSVANMGVIGVSRDGDNVTLDGLDNIPEQWRGAAESLARALAGDSIPDTCTCDVCLTRRSAKKLS